MRTRATGDEKEARFAFGDHLAHLLQLRMLFLLFLLMHLQPFPGGLTRVVKQSRAEQSGELRREREKRGGKSEKQRGGIGGALISANQLVQTT